MINLSGVLDIFKGKDDKVTPTPQSSPTPTTELSPTPAQVEAGMKNLVNVIGYKLDDAINTLQMISPSFSIISDKEEYSKEVPKGYVLDQDRNRSLFQMWHITHLTKQKQNLRDPVLLQNRPTRQAMSTRMGW